MDSRLHKTKVYEKIVPSIEVCKARYADHFRENNFQIYSINDGVKVKKFKKTIAQQSGIGEVLKSFDLFFYQNDQRHEFYKLQ